MKKVFVILFASAAFSFVGCKSGSTENGEIVDSAAAKEMVNEAIDSVNAANQATMDTAKQKMESAADTAKMK